MMTVPTHEDERLPTTGFEALYQDNYHDVWRYASFLLRNTVEAEDVASEAFARAFAAWSAGRGPRGDPRAWLLLITRRLVINRARRARLIKWLPLLRVPERADRGRGLEEREFRLFLDQLGTILTRKERDALFLRYLGDLNDETAGAVLGVSASGFRSLISRGLERLREHSEVWQ